MRDGIYKDLPMPRGWKSLLRACLREAERGEIAKNIAYKAMHADMKRDVSQELLKRFRHVAESTQPNLPGFGASALEFTAGVSATPHDRSIVQHAQRLHANGIGGRDLMLRAVTDGLADMHTQQLRQMEQHVYLSGRRDAREVMAAVRTACSGLAEQLAAECCGITPKRAMRATRSRVHADEDLAIQS